MQAPDAELIRTIAAAGCDARLAEAELCRRFAPRIFLYGRRHLRDEDRSRDLVQAVLLAVLQAARAGRVAEPEHADRFVLGTCRHVASRIRSTDQRTVPAEPDVLQALESSAAWTTWNEARADKGALVRCLAALDERSRQVVLLSFQDDRQADEIGSRLAMTAGNVRVTRHRAVAALRRCLETRVPARERAQ